MPGDEAVERAVVPVGVLRTPAVVDVVRALAVVERVQMERVQVVAVKPARIAGLGEDAEPAAVVQRQHIGIGEPGDSAV
jgi:hypothetical protein